MDKANSTQIAVLKEALYNARIIKSEKGNSPKGFAAFAESKNIPARSFSELSFKDAGKLITATFRLL